MCSTVFLLLLWPSLGELLVLFLHSQCCNSIHATSITNSKQHCQGPQTPKSWAPLQGCYSHCLLPHSTTVSAAQSLRQRSWVGRGFQPQLSLQSLGPGDGWVSSLPLSSCLITLTPVQTCHLLSSHQLAHYDIVGWEALIQPQKFLPDTFSQGNGCLGNFRYLHIKTNTCKTPLCFNLDQEAMALSHRHPHDHCHHHHHHCYNEYVISLECYVPSSLLSHHNL